MALRAGKNAIFIFKKKLGEMLQKWQWEQTIMTLLFHVGVVESAGILASINRVSGVAVSKGESFQ